MLIFFFFFRQKTAYEMRISDWSSDVCSSDLFSGDRITVRAATAKASKTRHISLNRIAREALAHWRKQNSDVVAVYGKVDNKKAMATLLDVAGISIFRSNDFFRYNFASWMAMRGVGLNIDREMQGYSEIKTTQQYEHLA